MSQSAIYNLKTSRVNGKKTGLNFYFKINWLEDVKFRIREGICHSEKSRPSQLSQKGWESLLK